VEDSEKLSLNAIMKQNHYMAENSSM